MAKEVMDRGGRHQLNLAVHDSGFVSTSPELVSADILVPLVEEALEDAKTSVQQADSVLLKKRE